MATSPCSTISVRYPAKSSTCRNKAPISRSSSTIKADGFSTPAPLPL